MRSVKYFEFTIASANTEVAILRVMATAVMPP
jgi:hypothetical protein